MGSSGVILDCLKLPFKRGKPFSDRADSHRRANMLISCVLQKEKKQGKITKLVAKIGCKHDNRG